MSTDSCRGTHSNPALLVFFVQNISAEFQVMADYREKSIILLELLFADYFKSTTVSVVDGSFRRAKMNNLKCRCQAAKIACFLKYVV